MDSYRSGLRILWVRANFQQVVMTKNVLKAAIWPGLDTPRPAPCSRGM